MSIISASTLAEKTFIGLDLSEPFHELFGKIEPKASALIWGTAGSGKSTLTLALANDLAFNAPVLYVSAEEGQGKTLSDRINRLQALHSNLFIAEFESLKAVREQAEQKKAGFIILDSISVIDPASREIELLREWAQRKEIGLFVIAHATKEGDSYKGDSAVGHGTDIVVQVEAGRAKTTKNRYKALSEIPVPFEAKDIQRKNPQIQVRKIESTDSTYDWTPNRSDLANVGTAVITQIEPKDYHKNPAKASEHFALQGIEFGNWVSMTERTQMLYSVIRSLEVIQKKFGVESKTIGFNGKLRLALGSRGGRTGKAAAHYEPEKFPTLAIYKTTQTGVAHEWAHAFDNVMGILLKVNSKMASEALITTKDTPFENWRKALVKSGFTKRLEDYVESKDEIKNKKYWTCKREVLARCSEKYFFDEVCSDASLNELIPYLVLDKGYYNGNKMYPTDAEMSIIAPELKYLFAWGLALVEGKKLVRETSGFKVGDIVRVKKYDWIMRIDSIKDEFFMLENIPGYPKAGNPGSYAADEIELKNPNARGFKISDATQKPKGKEPVVFELEKSVPKVAVIDFKADGSERKEGFYNIIEVNDLLASHSADGTPNTRHSISKGQPRDRSADELKNQPLKMAEKINPEAITEGTSAFSGAPVVNQNLEVIQGNGRAIALKIMYKHVASSERKYRDFLIKNAAKFGFTKDDVTSFHSPVLVRMIRVDNKEAVRLGNITNTAEAHMSKQDLAKANVRNLSEKEFANIGRIIETAKGETLGEVLDETGFKILRKFENLDTTPFLKKDGNLTEEGKAFLVKVFTTLLFDDAADKNALKFFNRLPFHIKAGIERAFGSLIALKGTSKDLSPELRKAVEIVTRIAESKDAIATVDQFMKQVDAFEGANKDRFSGSEALLATVLMQAKTQKAVQRTIEQYAVFVNGFESMFETVKPMSKTEAIENLAKRTNPAGWLYFNKLTGLNRAVLSKNTKVDEHSVEFVDEKGNPHGYAFVVPHAKKPVAPWIPAIATEAEIKRVLDQTGKRENPSTTLAFIGYCTLLETNAQVFKGNDFMFCTPDGSKIYIVPRKRVKQAGKVVRAPKAEAMHETFKNYAADGVDFEIDFPEAAKKQIGTAVSIEYRSDKVMQNGDAKGVWHHYNHAFENSQPVYAFGDCLEITQLEITERGILN